jgi:glycine/D-amino acid oxidase-like deaminating enzyme
MTREVPPFLGRSWWLLEALADDPGEPCPPLRDDVEADVVVVGGGYTGLWTAHRLLELAPGLGVVVLERDICGGGPSGRNGGFCSSLLDLEALPAFFGGGPAVALVHASEESVTEVGAWCGRHGIDAWFTRAGELGVATAPAQEGRAAGMLEAARRLGLSDRIVLQSADEVASRIRLPYRGSGVYAPCEATVQPARLVRGLRRVVLAQGARVFEGTSVVRLRDGDPVIAETPVATVRARSAVLAGGAWLAQLPLFRRRLAVRGTYIVLTAPAPDRLAEIGWTGGEGVWNFRTALNYLRTTPDGRIAFGTGLMQPRLTPLAGSVLDWHEGLVAEVARQFRAMFPSFADVPLEAAWGGPIDVSGAHLPFVGRRGSVHYAAGFTGNGVGPCQLAGAILARRALGIEDELTRLPIVDFEPKRFPPEPLRSTASLLVTRAVLSVDAAEDAGSRPGVLTDAVARLPRRLGYNFGP